MTDFGASYFDTNYRNYQAQNPKPKLDHYLSVVERMVPTEARVLDVGCGLGLWASHMAQDHRQWDVHGMDLDASIVAANAERHQGVSFHVGGVGDRTPGNFDAITAMDVLEHVPDVESRLVGSLRQLKPGGAFVAVMPVYDGPLGPVVRLLDGDPTHIHKWSRQRWLDLFGAHLQDLEWHGLFRILLPGGRYIHWPSHALRGISPAVLITGRVGGSPPTL